MKRKIALISEHASPLAALGGVDNGGQNVYVAQVARHLARLGHAVDVFTRKDRSDLASVHEWIDGIRIIHVPAGPPEFIRKEDLWPHMPAFVDYMLLFLKHQTRPYDLIHANFWMSGYAVVEIKKQFNIPFVITFHALGKVRRKYQNKDDGFPNIRFSIEEDIIAAADKIIAECPQDQEDLITLYNADPERIDIVGCGFDPDELWPIDKVAARRRLKLPLNEYLILQLGRMVPRKGVDNAIRGLARLKDKHGIRARLMIVGGESDQPDPAATPELGRLMEIAQAEGVADSILFMGRKPRHVLRYYYSAADIFVSTPWYEPFGITPVESMACGTPVIGSNVGGIKYSVAAGETGYLVEPENPEALADRVAELLNNPERLKRFRQQAVRRANAQFTWENITKALLASYEKVLHANQITNPLATNHVNLVQQVFFAAVDVFAKSRETLSESILQAGQVMSAAVQRGNKIMVCGNGGSAADSLHFSGELIGRFKDTSRPGIPVMSLTADIAAITAWANDVGYEKVFARQVEAFGNPGDVLLGISTTGNSPNLIEAFRTAQNKAVTCISLTGMDGGAIYPLSQHAIIVPSSDKQRIQETHLLILHLLSELIESNYIQRDRLVSQTLSSRHSGWEFQSTGSPLPITFQRDK